VRRRLNLSARGWSAGAGILLFLFAGFFAGRALAQGRDLLVFAAASLRNALDAHGDTLSARITRHTVLALGIKPGRHVFAVIKAVAFDQPTRRPGGTAATPANDGIVEV